MALRLLIYGLIAFVAAQKPNPPEAPEEERMHCGLLNPSECDPSVKACPFIQRCVPDDIGAGQGRLGCFAVWHNSTERGLKILSKGCWSSHSVDPCGDEEKCIATGPQSGDEDGKTFYCCCHKSMCNDGIRYEPTTTTSTLVPPTTPIPPSEDVVTVLIYAFAPVCLLATAIFVGYWTYRRWALKRFLERRKAAVAEETQRLSLPKTPFNPDAPLKPIHLMELKARGRFGAVWKGTLGEQTVAVKVFPAQDVDSWMQEQEIYAVSGMRHHPNILQYLGAEVHGSEFWIVAAFQERGSLYDFLKGHTTSPREALHIAAGALRGLAFLHEELIGASAYKPSIVHRDFKSKNILLKSDLTACLADFGLALKCEHGRTPNDTHGQVGTRRYMAPEVLEGATEFSASAFRQIDVYAAALVLWELLSRCRLGSEMVPEYKLPFEEEVGQHPSLQDMQETVVNKKQRPVLQQLWRRHPQLSAVVQTMEEMWDPEPEARITANCALERLLTLTSTMDPPPPYSASAEAPEATPLISDLAESTI